MAESIQDKLKRVRPPRVQITYDVETGDAIEKKELPLVVGIMADLAGKAEMPYLKNRKFVEIDRDNFNVVMEKITPQLAFQVDNRLEEAQDGGEGEEKEPTKMNVALKFQHIDDFRPEKLIEQIEPLKKLYEARQRLNDLVGKLDGNDNLDKLLQDIAANTDQQQTIKKEAGEGETDG